MTNDARRSRQALEKRRAALIARCAQQRLDAAHEVRELVAPVGSAGKGLKLPLTIAGVVLGMIATRPGRAMPMMTAGLALWKVARNLLPMLRALRGG